MDESYIIVCRMVFLCWGVAASPVYTVKQGDTLWDIAKAHKMSFECLCELNNKPSDWRQIHPGQEIIIDKESFYQYSVRKGDTLPKIARERCVKVEELRKWNGWSIGHEQLKPGRKIRIEKRAWIDWSNPKLEICWENVLKMLKESKCEDWEVYRASNDRILDGSPESVTLFDDGREIISAYACNAPLPCGRYRDIIDGSHDGRFCIKSADCDCEDYHFDVNDKIRSDK